jgi:hypothetical protein
MIAEYCKTGELVCYYDSDDLRWHITPESVESKIAKIKALNAWKEQVAAEPPVESVQEGIPQAQKTSEPLVQRARTDDGREEGNDAADEGRKLRAQLRRLKLDVKVNRRYIERLEIEHEKDRERMLQQSYQIGVLETEKKQLLEAPRPQTPPPLNVYDVQYTEEQPPQAEHASEAHRDAPLSNEHNDTTYDQAPLHPSSGTQGTQVSREETPLP